MKDKTEFSLSIGDYFIALAIAVQLAFISLSLSAIERSLKLLAGG